MFPKNLPLLATISIMLLIAYLFVVQNNNTPSKTAQLGNAISQATNSKAQSQMDKHNLPNEHFYMQRAYPDFDMPIEVVKNALREAQQQILQQSNAKQEGIAGIDADWLIEGPTNIGGRINAIAVHPTDANTIYAGSSRGGIHKTTDGGATWLPIFDEPLFNSIGDIIISPHNANTIYVGTGDSNIGSFFSIGDGVYRSTDAGATWQNIGLSEVGIISKIAIDPINPNQIYVAAMGNPIARDVNRGIYKTNDGGITWQKILFIDDDAGIIDLVMHPSQPNTLYAASWNRIRNLQETIVNEEDGKIWKSTDSGTTWTHLTNGLPDQFRSRIGLTISAQNPNRLAAVYVDSTQALLGVYTTDNGGETWQQTADISSFDSDPVATFGWYFGKIYFHPDNDQHLFLLGVGMHQSMDGGFSWADCTPPWWTYEVHADKHALAFSNGNLILGTDGGIYQSNDNTESWQDIESIANTQFYRVAVNPHEPNMYCGGAQDNGTTMGNADMINEWPRIYGGDGFQPVFHPTNPDWLCIEIQNGSMAYTTDGGMNFESANTGIDPDDRRNWDMPYIISKHGENALFAGTYRLYRSDSNDPPMYEVISPDLTDGNIYGNRFHNISTIDQSPLSPNYLYVGTSDGNIWHSLDAGNTWVNITDTLPDRYVTSIKASPHLLNNVYVSISGYKGNSREAHIFKSTNNGTGWTAISGNMPPIAVNDILVLPEDTTDNILFAATDAGVYMTANGGTTWQRLGGNMPVFSVFDIDYDPRNHKLVAATFARSIMSFDLSEVINFNIDNPVVGIANQATAQNATFIATYSHLDNALVLSLDGIAANNHSATSANISLFNLQGARLLQHKLEGINLSEYILPINNLSNSIYIVALEHNNKRYTKKISVVR